MAASTHHLLLALLLLSTSAATISAEWRYVTDVDVKMEVAKLAVDAFNTFRRSLFTPLIDLQYPWVVMTKSSRNRFRVMYMVTIEGFFKNDPVETRTMEIIFEMLIGWPFELESVLPPSVQLKFYPQGN
ncbi:hypothetical protein AXF42_Ash000312 [Apostasia shenzhenica]|uniref:Cystatin domain-containing protein n=1 Tax=Apostasia shenzhenica TaxID=1088818 RepID=A0A2I0AG26_9ASPA|nr:hypothetical protein AXF42_Ash000312 [Apostasia shenzhenica]